MIHLLRCKKSTAEDTEFTENCCFISVVFNHLPLVISIQRCISKIQPVSRYHDSIGIDVYSHGAPPQELAFHNCGARAGHLIKNNLTRRGITKDEVSRDVWLPVAPVVSDVRSPVAAVGEATDCGGFGGEGGGGANCEIFHLGWSFILVSPISTSGWDWRNCL